MQPLRPLAAIAMFCSLYAATVQASELVYVPINPNFGGNPLNGTILMNEAQAQNHWTDDGSSQPSKQSPLQQFQSSLENAILSRVSSAVASKIVGSNGQLIPGVLDTQDFTIAITSLGGGVLQITTTDKSTGQTTQFQVSQP